jgi:hypothetical protein
VLYRWAPWLMRAAFAATARSQTQARADAGNRPA